MAELVKLGESVVYHDDDGSERAGLVIGVHDLPNQIVTLAVFLTGDAPDHITEAIPQLQEQQQRLIQRGVLPPSIADWHADKANHKRPSVSYTGRYAVYSEAGEPGTWSWPGIPLHAPATQPTAAQPFVQPSPGLSPQMASAFSEQQREVRELRQQVALLVSTLQRVPESEMQAQMPASSPSSPVATAETPDSTTVPE